MACSTIYPLNFRTCQSELMSPLVPSLNDSKVTYWYRLNLQLFWLCRVKNSLKEHVQNYSYPYSVLTFSPGFRLATAFNETDVPKDKDKVSLCRFAFDLARTTLNKILDVWFLNPFYSSDIIVFLVLSFKTRNVITNLFTIIWLVLDYL